MFKSKEEGTDQKSIQSSTTPDFPADDHKAARNRQDSIKKTYMKLFHKKVSI